MVDRREQLQENTKNLQMQNILLQLSSAVTSLEKTTKEISTQKKIDSQLEKASNVYGDNSYALKKVYSDAQKEATESLSPILSQIQDLQMKTQQTAAKMQQNSDLLSMYNQRSSGVTDYNKYGYLTSADQMGESYRQKAAMLSKTSAYSPYFKENREAFGDFGVDKSKNVLPFSLEDASVDLIRRDMQTRIRKGEDVSNEEVENYFRYRKDMMQRTQEASLNYGISKKLGVEGGIVDPNEFKQGYMPALQKMSSALGISTPQVADILKNFKQIKAISSEFEAGTAASISNAMDELMGVLGGVATLTRSSSLKEILQNSKTIASFGGGNFSAGAQTILEPSKGQVQSSRERMAAAIKYANDPSLSSLGRTRARIETGLYRDKTTDMLNSVVDVNSPFIRQLGGTRSIASNVSGAINKMATQDQQLMLQMGRGNMMAGMDQMSDKAFADPASFLLNRPQMRYQSLQQNAGDIDVIRNRISSMQSMFPELSDNEAILAMSKGNPQLANSIKAVLQAKNVKLQKQQKSLRGAREMLRSLSYNRPDVGSYISEAVGGKSRPLSQEEMQSYVMGDQDVLGYGGLGRLRMSIGDLFGQVEQTDVTSNPSFNRRETTTYEEYESSTFAPQKNTRYRVRANPRSGNIAEEVDLDKMSITSAIVSGLMGPSAQSMVRDIIGRTSETAGLVSEGQVKRVLTEALRSSRESGTPANTIRRAIQFVNKQPLSEIRRLLSNELSADNEFMLILNKARSLQQSGGISTDRSATFKAYMAESFRRQGLSEEEIARRVDPVYDERMQIRESQKISDAIGEFTNNPVVVGTSIIGGIATGGMTAAALFAFDVASMAVEYQADMREGVLNSENYINTATGDSYIAEEIQEYFETEDPATGTMIGKELENITRAIDSLMMSGSSWRRLGRMYSGDDRTRALRTIINQGLRLSRSIVSRLSDKDTKANRSGAVERLSESYGKFIYGHVKKIDDEASKSESRQLARFILASMTNTASEIRRKLKTKLGVKQLTNEASRIINNLGNLSQDYSTSVTNYLEQNVLSGNLDVAMSQSAMFVGGAQLNRNIRAGERLREISEKFTQRLENNIDEETAEGIETRYGSVEEFSTDLSNLLEQPTADSLARIDFQDEATVEALEDALGAEGARAVRQIAGSAGSGEEKAQRISAFLSTEQREIQEDEGIRMQAESEKWGELIRGVIIYLSEHNQGEDVSDKLQELMNGG